MRCTKIHSNFAESLECPDCMAPRYGEFPYIDKESLFYKNCKQQRRRGAKICQVCPFRKGIELQEIR